jgi:hypothetical protein
MIMDIYINGDKADITLDSERTIGDVLSSLNAWLEGSTLRLHSIAVDGKSPAEDEVEDVLGMPVERVSRLDIEVCDKKKLLREALLATQKLLLETNPETAAWELSGAASFFREEDKDLYEYFRKAFTGDGAEQAAVETAARDAAARILEIEAPLRALVGLLAGTTETAARLENLALDLQTGKDRKAAETVALFSVVAEKLYRIYSYLTTAEKDALKIGGQSITAFFDDLGVQIQEMVKAYEDRDFVLAGDLAEYEIAPRLRSLASAIGEAV